MVPTVPSEPCAVIYPNVMQLYLPQYHPEFVRRMKALVPPHTRVFHQVPTPSYTIVAPHHHIALALAGEYFLDLVKVRASAPYEFPGDDRHLLARRRLGGRAEEIAARRGGGR
jgi:hypothetical protein